ncbi:hypothetical protein ABZ816_38470 [Actinosynnema sp. NPDC047251]|uniref:Putative secreted protein n=1 Tax=Saccharothrix espanaensis (strain ATCC 51144 / DSM 44229 / JCM 9112 / NBRC 15066 / NRRL 15764) TaxID=1179773 RepID=K0JPV6_SACES|nr:hypothetical protein [Saccharothrix espanaensis]CCH29205.1 putative secreted protein [Saccharothrix espanaensis DSM 44229]
MLDDFLPRPTRRSLARRVPFGPAGALTGGLALGALTGAAFGAVACLPLVALGLLRGLAGHRAELLRRLGRRDALISRYCDLIYGEAQPLWRIDRWTECVEVGPSGDVTATIQVLASVLRRELPFVRIRLGPNWDQPSRLRRRVRVGAVRVDIGRAPAQRYECTSHWLADGRLEVIVHFLADPPRTGDHVVLEFAVRWPRKAAPLVLSEKSDLFVMTMGNPLAHLRYRVTLPAGAIVYATAVDLRPKVDDYRLTTSTTTGGRQVAELVARDIAADRRFGMRLELE